MRGRSQSSFTRPTFYIVADLRNYCRAFWLEQQWKEVPGMKAILGGLVLSLFVTMMVVPADAKGCIKGAMVGGAAGHIAGHHGLLGAAAGYAIGHHEARKNEKATQNQH
jgi:hypothetical protein